MSDTAGNKGELLTLYELLSSRKITIPIIQRDYAQGRDEQLVVEIRERFLEALLSAVDGSKPLILDFVYGAIDENSFIPIDGQQRITTLFLLHWYLAVLEKREPDEYRYLLNFTYEIRESAQEFCHALVSHSVDLPQQKNHNLSEKIHNENWYHHVYNNDPTVQAMLTMLDAIHNKFHDLTGGYTNLVKNNMVSFWWLSLEDFGLTDDLFIKMNARGKRLTRFEIFKAEAEQATEIFAGDTESNKLREHWLNCIDNDWLDTFWAQSETPEKNAEDRLFLFILFLLRSLAAEKSSKAEKSIKYEGIGQLEYVDIKNDVQTICDKENLEFVCDALDAFDVYSNYRPIQNMLMNIISKEKGPTFLERTIVFGAIAYGNRRLATRTNDTFFHILKYLAIGQRSVDERSKKFGNALDAENYGSFIGYLKHFVNGIQASGDNTDLLKSMKETPDKMNTFLHAIEKADYCLPNGKLDQSRHEEIQALEDMGCFCGQIHNVFFDGKLWLSSQKMKQLVKVQESNPRLLLRCIQAMSDEVLLLYGYNGSWKQAKMNGKQEQFRLYKYFFGFNPSDSGDYLWTANPDSVLGNVVRGFIQECTKLPFADLEKELNDWLKEKIVSQQNYADLVPYITKYDEFLGYAKEKPNGFVYLLEYNYASPRSDLTRVFIDLESGWNNYSFLEHGKHYNPFVMALHNRLVAHNSKTLIRNQWMCKKDSPNVLNEWVKLSNGRKLRLMINDKEERYWKLDGGIEWDCSGKDCIDVAFQNIIAMT